MAAANILTTGNTELTSADVVVAAGAQLVVGIKGAENSGDGVSILIKDDTGAYRNVGFLEKGHPRIIEGPATYAFKRVQGVTCGVFSA